MTLRSELLLVSTENLKAHLANTYLANLSPDKVCFAMQAWPYPEEVIQ